ncbi:MAG: hypothetical protein EP346_00705 [Bacteroidetes bacterium]|nr:MAG: hypothetical protein EP346_00705 [Bacteroidota bacterium]
MKAHQRMRVIHRYLGFFLTGIMSVYALSGIVLVYRDTDTFKRVENISKNIGENLGEEALGEALEMRRFRVDSTSGAEVFFRDGVYNRTTGMANYTVKETPFVLDQLLHLHKATSSRPLSFLNVFFGLSLLFFVISSFWMYFPGTDIFKKGMYFTIAGLVFALLLIFI